MIVAPNGVRWQVELSLQDGASQYLFWRRITTKHQDAHIMQNKGKNTGQYRRWWSRLLWWEVFLPLSRLSLPLYLLGAKLGWPLTEFGLTHDAIQDGGHGLSVSRMPSFTAHHNFRLTKIRPKEKWLIIFVGIKREHLTTIQPKPLEEERSYKPNLCSQPFNSHNERYTHNKRLR